MATIYSIRYENYIDETYSVINNLCRDASQESLKVVCEDRFFAHGII